MAERRATFARRARAALLLAALCCAPVQAQVEATLVAADRSVQPGKPLVVAVRLQHAPHWHSFWENAGTGLPTRIDWTLPEGWHAGAIEWPTPIVIEDKQGNVSGHGYEGVTYLAVPLATAAAARPGETVTLRALARWLMCDVECIPGQQALTLTLPISAAPAEPDAAVRAALATRSLPQPASDWKLAASRDERQVTLHAAAPAGALKDLHFFPLDAFVAYKEPQTAASRANMALLKLAIDREELPAAPQRLRGVLAYTDANGGYRGVQVDVPFSAPAAAVALAGTAPLGGHDETGAPAAAGLSVGLLLLALLGGLVLNLMPCVFPVLGIKILGFIDQAGSDRRKVALQSLAFAAGVLLSFWALAGLLALLRAGGRQLGWGFQLQSAPFVFALGALMLLFALNLSGVFEVGVRATAVGSRLQLKRGTAGAFFSGVLATVVATPCSAPFLAPALGAALALPLAQSFVLFTLIAIGLASPYLLLAAFPRLLGLLPRPGAWMETFKQAMAFALYATAAYLVWVLAAQTGESGLLAALLALTLVAFAAWFYGRFAGAPRARRPVLAAATAAALLVSALYLGWPRAAPAGAITWEPWSTERITALRAQGRPVYVDFTARWCATCQVNKKVVFSSQAVTTYFRDNQVATLKADWTNSDPAITAELAKWNRSAVPFNLVYRAGGAEPMPLSELLTPSLVLDAFQGAAPP